MPKEPEDDDEEDTGLDDGSGGKIVPTASKTIEEYVKQWRIKCGVFYRL